MQSEFRDCQQITFTTLNRFCPLSKNPPPPVLNGQNHDGWNANQNQLKNKHLFHIVFEVLKVLFIKICKMQPTRSFITCCFMLDFTSAVIIFH